MSTPNYQNQLPINNDADQYQQCARCGVKINMALAHVTSTYVPGQVKFALEDLPVGRNGKEPEKGTLDRLHSMVCKFSDRKPDSKKPCLYKELSFKGILQAPYGGVDVKPVHDDITTEKWLPTAKELIDAPEKRKGT